MKKVSVLLTVISLVIAGFSFSGPVYRLQEKHLLATDSNKTRFLSELLNEMVLDAARDVEKASVIDDEEFEKIINEIAKSSKTDTSSNNLPLLTMLWIKLGFSLLFGGSALYVVLSQKYNEETQKWAFGVLSLISGVWIGTAS